ncbi:SDR family oxidoreductase [Corynebacterium glyciniphilum]|uniref:2,3-dihydro-2,3-dihydroxybenzoate dehydrogenase n=1 Tax=Corynebacterium glyciniphilum AJ 3170 TaxID=1404245 RepID=X5E6R7_9CORY|nr:SDR family oxidoreductase [Corynebacterium glyciniphilum]AHW63140.1 2,3-dihydro-2,3-dihydroxybenzoate dehydrogenase [Corynebacterium glyciniphilum AJ 3170]
MAADLHGSVRHHVVTGAAGGIGSAVVTELLSAGHTVTAADISYPRGISRVERSGPGVLHHVGLDVGDSHQVDSVVRDVWNTVGAVDSLVNGAGVIAAGPGEDATDEDWERQFSVNAFGVFAMCRALGPRMAANGGGSIVTVGSNAGTVPRSSMTAYAASKAAASSVTRSFGLELGRQHVRCNVVCPGTTRTSMIEGLGSEATLVAGQPELYKSGIPLGRIASPEDIASVVVFLSGDGARHMTLQEVVVDGGASQR